MGLSDPTVVQPTFRAPVLTEAETLFFKLLVTDNGGATASDTVAVLIQPVNAAPIANAGLDFLTYEHKEVTLTGTASDIDGQVAAYQWRQTLGESVVISNPATATPSFVAPAYSSPSTKLTFQLTVTDNEGGTATDLVEVTVLKNTKPIANAGEDQTADELDKILLSGSARDDNGPITSYTWQQISGPTVNLTNANAAVASFTGPSLDTRSDLIFKLVVTDYAGLTDDDTVTITVRSKLIAPPNFTANGGNLKVGLLWDMVEIATGYNLYYAEESFNGLDDLSNYASLQGGTLIQDVQGTGKTLDNLTNGVRYFFRMTSLKNSRESDATSEVSAQPVSGGVVQANATNNLNDTGIEWAGDGDRRNKTDCTGGGSQDCGHGRDALALVDKLSKTGSGKAGFDFTRIERDGTLYVGNGVYEDSPWACVKDNVTGLIWEVKTKDNGLHDRGDSYTWYNTDNTKNGGESGSPAIGSDTCFGYSNADSGKLCNTKAFVDRVNSEGWCGANDWRVPTQGELFGIQNLGYMEPSIDGNYFPNTQYADSSYYWSDTPSINDENNATAAYFYWGGVSSKAKSTSLFVRLVRDGKK